MSNFDANPRHYRHADGRGFDYAVSVRVPVTISDAFVDAFSDSLTSIVRHVLRRGADALGLSDTDPDSGAGPASSAHPDTDTSIAGTYS